MNTSKDSFLLFTTDIVRPYPKTKSSPASMKKQQLQVVGRCRYLWLQTAFIYMYHIKNKKKHIIFNTILRN